MKIVAYGEIMMRLSPLENTSLKDATVLDACYGGTESNVLVALSHLGNKTSFVSKVPNNSLGEGVKRHLLRHEVGVEHLILDGAMLGIYFLEPGFGPLPSKVTYHRKNAVVNTLLEDDLNYDEIFKDASWFHVTGISLAISKNSKDVSLRLCKEAKKRNVKVSFDFNYRSTLWTKEEAKEVYKEIMQYVDVCFGNLYDINTFIDINENNELDSINRFLENYNVNYLLNTNRKIINASTQSLKASIYYRNNNKVEVLTTNEETFEVLDRIGGGDAFVAGVIHILNKDYSNIKEAIELGLKCDVLKHFVKGDVLALSKKEIEEFVNVSKDVIR